jgi:hypothetical protein
MRRVRRMHLRAGAEDDARRAVILLADALQTASLPAADEGRLVIIRRLPLGRISARVSPASLALHVERAAQSVMSQAVTCDLPAAETANAVVFPDRSQAIITLAGLLASGAPADEWFWPEVVRGWRVGASRGERWALLLQAAHGFPEAAVVAAAVVNRAIGAGVEDALLSAVPAGQGARWLRTAGWTSLWPDAAPPMWRPPGPCLREAILRWRQTWGPTDDRLIWLTTLLTVAEHPACAADPRLPARVAFALRTFQGAGSLQPGYPPRIIPRDDCSILSLRVEFGEPVASAPASSRVANADRTVERAAGTAHPLDSPSVHVPRPSFTSFAGLLFVVRILERLGFATFLAAQPAFLDDGSPMRLLWFIGRRAGLPPTDPLALALRADLAEGDDPLSPVTEAVTFDLPHRACEILTSPKPRTPLDSPFTAWLTAVRRWSRRHARMGLTTLIRRPGRIHISSTHIGAGFALSQIDVRVRRLALDVDPGWVPWMGRIVQFSYGEHH